MNIFDIFSGGKTITQKWNEWREFKRNYPWVAWTIVILIIFVTFSSMVNSCEKKQNTILKGELDKVRDEKHSLELQLVPFKTVALQQYPTLEEAEALKKLATKIQEVESIAKNYNYIAQLNLYGQYSLPGNDRTLTSTELDADMRKVFTNQGNNYYPILTEEAEQICQSVIHRYPDYPFTYYYLAVYLYNKGDNSWVEYANKAVGILKITTTVAGHNSMHDSCLNELIKLLSKSEKQ